MMDDIPDPGSGDSGAPLIICGVVAAIVGFVIYRKEG